MSAEHGNSGSQNDVIVAVVESLDRQIEALTKARNLLRDEPVQARRAAPRAPSKVATARILRMASRP